MSASKDIIRDIQKELNSKINQREVILDQLQILDVLIDNYDGIIENIDREVLSLTKPINDVANEVKAAYDARISAGCRSNLKWVELSRYSAFVPSGGGGVGTFQTVITYQVQENPETVSFKPYDGIKFYQKPSNRDYGSVVVAEFTGNVSQGSTIISVNIPEQSVINVLSNIQTGDTITDNLTSPQIFNLGSLPEVVGTGTTNSVGIITTIVGGIFTSGAGTTFFHFGAGSLADVEEGMLLIHPGVFSGGEVVPVLEDNTTIVGFGTGDYPIEYFDDVGILTTSFISCNTITIDNPALQDLEEGTFTVGIVTTFPALFITTTSNQTTIGASFFAIRTADRDNIDAGFDFTSSPNSPVKIGSIGPGNLGVGSSAYYDFSGEPAETQSWRPESARDEIRGGKNNKNILVAEIKEPKVGAGQAPYNIGTLQWPTTSVFEFGGLGGVFNSYAPLGTIVRTSFGSMTASYVSSPPGGFPGNCAELDATIAQAEANYSTIVSQNRPSAQRISRQTISLRTVRDGKERIAYSLLQAASSLRADIKNLREILKELDDIDFSTYET
jgi:hypothetical protein